MTTTISPHIEGEVVIPNLDQILGKVRSSDDPVIAKRRPQLITTLNRLIRHGGVDPATVPFVPAVIQAVLANITPGTSGLTKKSIQNDWSNLRFLLEHFDLSAKKLSQVKLISEYLQMYKMINDRHLRAGVSRLLRFAQVQRIPLAEFDDTSAERFQQFLRQDVLVRNSMSSWRSALRAWNKLRARFPELNLRELTLPATRRGWGEAWAAFPASLEAEVDAHFLARSVEGDLFDPDSPDVLLRPRTIETQKDWLRTLASAAVRSGVPISSLSRLEELVKPAIVESALRWFLDIHRARRTEYVVMLAIEALTIAKAIGTLTDAEIDRLRRLVRRLRTHIEETAEEPKRLDRLLQFESRDNVLKMLALSEHVVHTVRSRGTRSRSDLLTIQLALVHELLLATSMRRTNIAELNLDEHLTWPDGPEGDCCVIRIPKQRVKNAVTLHKELPFHVVSLLKYYLDEWRPLHPNSSSPWLFPGRDGTHKVPGGLGHQYKTFMLEWTGLDVTPHLLRSFADMIYTERHPEGGEVIRRQLGQRSPETRIKHYADPRSRAAGRTYQALILEERKEALERPGLFQRKRRSKRFTNRDLAQ